MQSSSVAFVSVVPSVSAATCAFTTNQRCRRTTAFRPSSRHGRTPTPTRFVCCDKGSTTPTPPDSSQPAQSSSDYLARLNDATERRKASSNDEKDPDDNPVPPTILGTTISVGVDQFGNSAEKPSASSSSDSLQNVPQSPIPTEFASQLQKQSESTSSSSSTEGQQQTSDASVMKTTAPSYAAASRALWRISWVCWWPQFALTCVAAVVILFSLAFPTVNVSASASTVGFVLTSASVIFALVSLVYTYSYTRLSIFLSRPKTSVLNDSKKAPVDIPARINARLTYGLAIALIGLLVATAGLQAVVGSLLARLLTSGFGRSPAQTPNSVVYTTPLVQPIDVLVVQACSNVILALLISAMCTCWFLLRSKAWQRKAQDELSGQTQ